MERERKSSTSYRNKNKHVYMIAGAKIRAREKGWEFDLDKHADELAARVSKMVCELTGMPMSPQIGKHGALPLSPTLDRIDAKKGYTYDNVRIVCRCVNNAFSNWGADRTYDILYPWFKKEEQRRLSQGTSLPELSLAA